MSFPTPKKVQINVQSENTPISGKKHKTPGSVLHSTAKKIRHASTTIKKKALQIKKGLLI